MEKKKRVQHLKHLMSAFDVLFHCGWPPTGKEDLRHVYTICVCSSHCVKHGQ